MRSVPRRAGAVVVALALSMSGCFGDEAPVVQTERVGPARVTQTVTAPARVEAAARQDVATAVSGVVVAVEVADGDRVEAGQVVVRLDSTQVELEREQARAARAAASSVGGIHVHGGGDATVATVERALAELDAKIAPRIAEAREKATAVEDDEQRALTLAGIDAVEVSYLSTRAGLLATGQALARQQDAVARSLSQALNQAIRQATAGQAAQAEAAAAAAEAQAEALEVRAPFAGTVQLGEAAATSGAPLGGELPQDVGALAQGFAGLADAQGGGTLRVGAPVVAGQTLFTVYDLSTKYANAEVDEVDAPEVAAGQRATVLVDAFPDVVLEGVVEGVAVQAETTEAGGVGYPARIRILASARGDEEAARAIAGLKVGMTASAEIATRAVDAATAVPSRALLRRGGATIVFVVRDGVARAVPVRVEALGEDLAAVRGELAAGERVVVAGYEDLTDGDEVETR